MKTIINLIHLTVNLGLLIRVVFVILNEKDKSVISFTNESNPFTQELKLISIIQLAQITDFFMSSGNLFSVLLQYLSRTVLSLFFLNASSSYLSIILILVPWTLADSVRYSFYLSKNSLISFLR
jgi:hypothetical protein